jgi:hypothetical protein
MTFTDHILSRGPTISLMLVSVLLFATSVSYYDVNAQQGGAATGGDATTGGAIFHCTSEGACTIT